MSFQNPTNIKLQNGLKCKLHPFRNKKTRRLLKDCRNIGWANIQNTMPYAFEVKIENERVYLFYLESTETLENILVMLEKDLAAALDINYFMVYNGVLYSFVSVNNWILARGIACKVKPSLASLVLRQTRGERA
jgi:hypothetical protein